MVATLLALIMGWRFQTDQALALRTYRDQQDRQVEQAANRLRGLFEQTYYTCRTLGRLPSVRSLDRVLSPGDHQTLSELYDALAAQVDVSELYVVPRDFDPEKNETPLLTFADQDAPDPSQTPKIESFEYRAIQEQLAWFSQNAARDSDFPDHSYPAQVSSSLVTCDNSRYRPSAPDDRDRSGVVLSVPFYGPRGELRGCISAVILLHALSDQLSPSIELHGPDELVITPHDAEGGFSSPASPGQYYRGEAELDLPMLQGVWTVQGLFPDSLFQALPEVRGAREMLGVGLACLVALLLAALWGISLMQRQDLQVVRLHRMLSSTREAAVHIDGVSTSIQAAARDQESAVTEQAATAAEISATAHQIAATSSELARSLEELTRATQESEQLMSEAERLLRMLGNALEAIESSGSVLSGKLDDLQDRAGDIGQITTTISKVADQTNLLSLNAALEAEAAGSYGLGFRVVADEIRRLADQAGDSTLRIEQLLSGMQTAVAAGEESMQDFRQGVISGRRSAQEVVERLRHIVSRVRSLGQGIQAVNEAMQSQATGAAQISDSITGLNQVSNTTVQVLRNFNQAVLDLRGASQALVDNMSSASATKEQSHD